ncbi:MAG: hypothetical protein M3015_00910 [Bacteroidota bacterium]|nr:hypothetical protein [Bacteroidota bacterium]
MSSYQIQIYSGNTTSGQLKMSDNGTTPVNRGDQVIWFINGGNVRSFHIVGKSPGNIFTKTIPTNNTTTLSLDVSSTAPSGDWNYSIIWIDNLLGGVHTFDPKIAVNPNFDFDALIWFIVTTIGSLLAVKFFRKR